MKGMFSDDRDIDALAWVPDDRVSEGDVFYVGRAPVKIVRLPIKDPEGRPEVIGQMEELPYSTLAELHYDVGENVFYASSSPGDVLAPPLSPSGNG
jgi:hypothetical protein